MKRNAFTLIELIIVIMIVAIIGCLIATNLNKSASSPTVSVPLQSATVSVPLQSPGGPKVELETPGSFFLCESVSALSTLPDGKEIQELVVTWQKTHPKAKIASIIAISRNQYAIKSLVISAYSSTQDGK